MGWLFSCQCGAQFGQARDLHQHRLEQGCDGFEVGPRVIDLPHSSLLVQLGRWEMTRLVNALANPESSR